MLQVAGWRCWEIGIFESRVVPFVQWEWGRDSSFREGMTCSTRMGEPPGGDGVRATRPEGLDSDNDEKAAGEEGQNGANNDQGWSSSGW